MTAEIKNHSWNCQKNGNCTLPTKQQQKVRISARPRALLVEYLFKVKFGPRLHKNCPWQERTEPAHPTLKQGWPHGHRMNSFYGSLKMYMTSFSVVRFTWNKQRVTSIEKEVLKRIWNNWQFILVWVCDATVLVVSFRSRFVRLRRIDVSYTEIAHRVTDRTMI